LDIVFSKNKSSAMLLKPLESKIFALDTGFYPIGSESFYVDTKPVYLTREGLLNYLKGDVSVEKQRFFDASELYLYERRTGIALNKNKKTTEEGMLLCG
jgi:CRISPR/Cas system CMR-associated protein Cmr3 (group 5 of RAMP superfamily)